MVLPPDQIMHSHLGGEEWFGLGIGAFLGSLAILAGLFNAYVYVRGGPQLQSVKGGPRGALSSAILGILCGSYFVWVSMIYIRPRAAQASIQSQREQLHDYLATQGPDVPPELFLQYVRVGAIGIDDDIDTGSELVEYLDAGKLDAAQTLMRAGASIEAHGDGAKPPLLTAVDADEPDTVRFLLAAHADPNAAEHSQSGNRPIFDAVNPDPDPIPATHSTSAHPDEGDNTPPISYTSYHRREITAALVAAGADLNLRDDRSYTPLMIAAATGQCDMVATLLAGHPDLSLRANTGETALDWAKQEHPECVPLLQGTRTSAIAAAHLIATLPPPSHPANESVRQNREARTNVEEARAKNVEEQRAIDRKTHPLGRFTDTAASLLWSLIVSTVLYCFHRIRSFIRGDRQPVHWSWVPVFFNGSSSSFTTGNSSDESPLPRDPGRGGGSSGGAGAGGDF